MVKLNAKQRREINKVLSRYSKYVDYSQIGNWIQNMYNELKEKFGIEVPAWGAWDGTSHPFEINGEEVENSLFVYQVYKAETSQEFNIYVS